MRGAFVNMLIIVAGVAIGDRLFNNGELWRFATAQLHLSGWL